ncbi:MAG: PilX N-terminal domain-containing pilus assembly protein [Pseudomonadota bacterium]|nr:PilX N-terminal domain-containing pilus assembly protein [Pseudomonadota bacterium]
MNDFSMHRMRRMPPRRGQQGAALFVAMIMVLLLLVIAVAGMRTVTLESRIGGNMLQSHNLQETADGTLREGERTIQAFGISLQPCASGAKSPVTGGKPCFISEARADTNGLKTTFTVSAKATGFDMPKGYWYPRYITTQCPKGASATAALESANTGCTEFYEVNSQATLSKSDEPQACGPDALCLRSSINLFIK